MGKLLQRDAQPQVVEYRQPLGDRALFFEMTGYRSWRNAAPDGHMIRLNVRISLQILFDGVAHGERFYQLETKKATLANWKKTYSSTNLFPLETKKLVGDPHVGKRVYGPSA